MRRFLVPFLLLALLSPSASGQSAPEDQDPPAQVSAIPGLEMEALERSLEKASELFSQLGLRGDDGNAKLAAAMAGDEREDRETEPPLRPDGRLELAPRIRVSEIMYHPGDEGAEFLEITNTGVRSIPIGGFSFSRGPVLTFDQGLSIEAGQHLVLVSSPTDFAAVYPDVEITASYTANLSNGGERITLLAADQTQLLSFNFDDAPPWPATADGLGFSLVPIDLDADPSDPANWRASFELGGSPGRADPAIDRASVLVSEALTHTDLPQVDAIELFNPGAQSVDIRGWLLSDDRSVAAKARIPDEPTYIVPAGGYVVLDESQFADNPGSLGGQDLPGFRLSSNGGEGVYLFATDQAGALTGASHGYEISAAENGISFGRHLTSTGASDFVAQLTNTLGSANAGPRVGPVVIETIDYHPLPGRIEHLSLLNLSNDEVELWDAQEGGEPDNTWTIGGIAFSFPPGTTLAAGARLLVVNADPSIFREAYSVPTEVQIFGPFGTSGGGGVAELSNDGEAVTLRWPDRPDPDSGTVPMITMDRVLYDDRSPWPDADGSGSAMQRRTASLYGNDPENWQAAPACYAAEGCPDPPDPTDLVFAADRILDIEIEMTEQDWQELSVQGRTIFDVLAGEDCLDEPFSKPFTYFPGSVTVDGLRIASVGVRKKGFIGSLSEVKPSLKIKFDEFVSGQSYSGLDRLTFNNAQQDPSYVDQCMGYQIFAAAGIPAPRCNYATVSINGRPLGIYVNVESVKRPFLSRFFERTDGNLYEGTLSDFREGWLGTFEPKTDATALDGADLLAVAEAVSAADSELFAALAEVLDVDAFFRFWALEVLVGHWDGYASNTNNFFVYNDPDSGLFSFFPWGMDAVLSEGDPFGEDDQSLAVALSGVLANRIYSLAEGRTRYVDEMQDLLDTAWNEATILAEIDRMASLLRPHAAAEELFAFEAALAGARSFVTNRRERILDELQPDPPILDEPLRDPPCLVPIGGLEGSFETTWDTRSDDPFLAGTGTFSAIIEDTPWIALNVGAVAGPNPDPELGGRAEIVLVAVLLDGRVAIVFVEFDPQALFDGSTIPIDFVSSFGALLLIDPSVSQDAELIGLLGAGTLHLDQASSQSGAPITGQLDAQVYTGLFF